MRKFWAINFQCQNHWRRPPRPEIARYHVVFTSKMGQFPGGVPLNPQHFSTSKSTPLSSLPACSPPLGSLNAPRITSTYLSISATGIFAHSCGQYKSRRDNCRNYNRKVAKQWATYFAIIWTKLVLMFLLNKYKHT